LGQGGFILRLGVEGCKSFGLGGAQEALVGGGEDEIVSGAT
jgi:hypothetical protein